MSVKREDLQAAAAVGVVQYTQVDPLLIFLLQRDMNHQREAMLKEKRPARMSGVHVAFYMLTLLFIGVATAMIALYTKLAVDALGAVGILWFIGLYAFLRWWRRPGSSAGKSGLRCGFSRRRSLRCCRLPCLLRSSLRCKGKAGQVRGVP